MPGHVDVAGGEVGHVEGGVTFGGYVEYPHELFASGAFGAVVAVFPVVNGFPCGWWVKHLSELLLG